MCHKCFGAPPRSFRREMPYLPSRTSNAIQTCASLAKARPADSASNNRKRRKGPLPLLKFVNMRLRIALWCKRVELIP